MARKERCLTKAWKELGTQKRWVWGRQTGIPSADPGKISMVLSPVESWGDFTGPADSLIQIQHDQKLPSDVMERLNYQEPDQVMAGRDGNILDSAAKENPTYNENNFIEIVEPQIKIPEEALPETLEDEKAQAENVPAEKGVVEKIAAEKSNVENTMNGPLPDPEPISMPEELPVKKQTAQNHTRKETQPITSWSKFPKPIGANKKLGNR